MKNIRFITDVLIAGKVVKEKTILEVNKDISEDIAQMVLQANQAIKTDELTPAQVRDDQARKQEAKEQREAERKAAAEADKKAAAEAKK